MLLIDSSISCVFLKPTVAQSTPAFWKANLIAFTRYCFHTIVMTMLELTATAELHADHTQPFLLQLVDVIDHFAHIVWVVGVLVGRAVHACAVVVDADQSHVEPVCARHLPQRRQPVH